MNIQIKATNTSLTSSLREYIQDKLGHLEKFIKEEDKIRVEFEVLKKHKSGFVHRAEIDIQPRGFYADALGEDLYAAIDLVIPKIKEQLVKMKDKRVERKRRLARQK